MPPIRSLGVVVATLLLPAAALSPAALRPVPRSGRHAVRILASPRASADKPPDLEKVTEKYGLEAGLFSAIKNSGKGADAEEGGSMAKAKELLKRYGGAYLLTSTSLAIVSFTLCYTAIENGVDVASLLQKLNIEVSSTSETVGTFGIAYAVHKAASPIRFPPTVALTPIVARSLFGRKDDDDGEDK